MNANRWNFLNNNYETYNVADEATDPASILNWYKKLIKIRNDNPILQTGTFQVVPNTSEQVISFIRQEGERSVLVLINVSNQSVSDIDLDVFRSQIFSKTYEATNLMDGSIASLVVTAEDVIEDMELVAYEMKIYQLDETTSTESLLKNKDLKIYPNPSDGWFTIEFPEDLSAQQISISNIAGQVVFEQQLQMQGGKTNLDLSYLERGLYFLRLNNGLVQKLILK